MGYPILKAEKVAKRYAERFGPTAERFGMTGFSLRSRVDELLAEYPNVVAPNWLSWEGETLTGADTTAKLRDLRDALYWLEGLPA